MSNSFGLTCVAGVLLSASMGHLHDYINTHHFRAPKTLIGHLHDDIIYYYDQNPSGFSFLMQITAFVI